MLSPWMQGCNCTIVAAKERRGDPIYKDSHYQEKEATWNDDHDGDMTGV